MTSGESVNRVKVVAVEMTEQDYQRLCLSARWRHIQERGAFENSIEGYVQWLISEDSSRISAEAQRRRR